MSYTHSQFCKTLSFSDKGNPSHRLKKKAEMHADTLLCFESLSSVFLTFIFIDMKSNSPMGIETRSFCVLHRAPLSETEKNQASNSVA